MLNPGTILGNRYEIIGKIGTGGMADVYKGKDLKLNRFIAVKVLKSEYSSNKNFVSKFKVEAQSAAGLMHHNIVNVYDVGEENGLYYFVMELVEGITLKNYIEKKIRLSYKEALSIAIQVSNGIEAAHNNGIIHRDIKPQNIIISREGKVKVADFGIARAASSDTVTSHAMGSVHYTSPEQARGGYSDAKSDIYSIGITLFEMVTGRVPFDGETTVSIAIKHIQEEMPSPKVYVPDLPISVEMIIMKCTQKNPDRRYYNIGELIKDLKKACVSPDEDFVVIQDARSNAGTKVITDADRVRVNQQTNKPVFETPEMPVQDMNQPVQQPQNPPRDIYDQYGDDDEEGYDDGRLNSFPGAPQRGHNQGQQPQGYANQGQPAGYQNGPQGYNNPPQNRMYRNEPPYEDDGFEDDDWEREEELRLRREERIRQQEEKRRRQEQMRRQEMANRNGSRNDRHDRYDDRRRGEELDDDMDPRMEKITTILMIIVAIAIAIVAVVFILKVTKGSDKKDRDNNFENSEEYGENSDSLDFDISSGDNTDSVNPGMQIAVPDVVGKTEAEARVAIENEGFVFVKELVPSASVEKGIVVQQNPLGAFNAPKGSEIHVMISDGPDTSESVVPDIVGQDKETAMNMLTEAGLLFNTPTEEANDSVEAGRVLEQSIAAGTTVTTGTYVDFKVSTGPATYMCSFAVQQPADYLPGTMAIITLVDPSNNQLESVTTTTFPYSLVKNGIVGANAGYITITYTNLEGMNTTTAPVAVSFVPE